MTTAAHPPRPGPGGAALLVLVALAAWSGSIARGGFSYDDHALVSEDPVVRGDAPWSAAFARDFWHARGDAGLWRPAATLSLRLDHALWGAEARGYHATNVLLHALVVAAAARLLAGLGTRAREPSPRGPALLGLAVFAVHPALADSVAWISGRSSALTALGGLAGALGVAAAARRRNGQIATAAAAGLGLLLALGAKEDGVVFAPLYVALGLARSRAAARAAALGAALGLAAYLAARGLALGSPWPAASFAPLADAPLGTRLAVAGRAWIEGLRVLAVPLGYPPAWTAAELAPHTAGDLAIATGGGLVAATLVTGTFLARRAGRRLRPAHVSATLAGLALLPYAQLVPASEVAAPRFLYLPLLLATPLVDAGLRRALPRGRARGALLAGGLALAVVLAWTRAGVYADVESYWRERLRHDPTDARAWNALGTERWSAGERGAARAAFERATALAPDYSRPWTNLGGLALEAGEPARAETLLRAAVRAGPENPVAHANLGRALLELGRVDEARAASARACELASGLAAAWRSLARAEEALGRPDAARAALERALALDPGDARARRALDRLEDP